MIRFKILIGASTFLPLLGCQTLQMGSLLGEMKKPEVVSVAPRIAGLDLEGVNLEFDVDVSNPYSVPIKSPQFRYGMDVEGAEFLKSEATSKLDLPAKGVGTVTLPVRLKYLDLWQSYASLKDKAEVAYALKGALVFSPLGETIELPIEKRGNFPVLRMPKFTSMEMEPPQVSLGAANINVKTMVLNPNVFDVGLEDLGYALKIGTIDVGGLSLSTLKSLQAGQSGQLNFSGRISGFQAVQQIFSGQKIGEISILPTGSLQTPYGAVRVP